MNCRSFFHFGVYSAKSTPNRPWRKRTGGQGAFGYNFARAGIAQLVEQLICNQKVAGSIPAAGTISHTFISGSVKQSTR